MAVPDEVIVLTGVNETIAALKEFDKDAVREFNNVINDELTRAEREARGFVADVGTSPMRGWRETAPMNPRSRGGKGWPGWYGGEVQAGITKTRVQGKANRSKGYTTSAGALLNKSAAGGIFEIAGRKNAGSGKGAQFIANLTKFAEASRLVWRAVDQDRDKIQTNVKRALDVAKAKVQARLDKERIR